MADVVNIADYRKKPQFPNPLEMTLSMSRDYALAGAAMLALIAEILDQQAK